MKRNKNNVKSIALSKTVLKTDTGILDEKSKAIGSIGVKEFGKLAP